MYEESSLGVFPDSEDAEQKREEEFNSASENRVAIWGKYLLRHARRQLSFDMWWLALSLLLLCIIERSNLMNTANATWFNIFAVLFEIVSAYGTVGLSLGIPTENYSLSGAFNTLSKLIICFVMLRGRHRGLPVALDRAVMLPHEFQEHPDQMQPPRTNTAVVVEDEKNEREKTRAEKSPKSHNADRQKSVASTDDEHVREKTTHIPITRRPTS